MRVRLLVILLAAMAPLGCTAELDEPCGPAMRYDDAAFRCVCTDDAIQVEGGCQRCAADEVPVANVCTPSCADDAGCASADAASAARSCESPGACS